MQRLIKEVFRSFLIFLIVSSPVLFAQEDLKNQIEAGDRELKSLRTRINELRGSLDKVRERELNARVNQYDYLERILFLENELADINGKIYEMSIERQESRAELKELQNDTQYLRNDVKDSVLALHHLKKLTDNAFLPDIGFRKDYASKSHIFRETVKLLSGKMEELNKKEYQIRQKTRKLSQAISAQRDLKINSSKLLNELEEKQIAFELAVKNAEIRNRKLTEELTLLSLKKNQKERFIKKLYKILEESSKIKESDLKGLDPAGKYTQPIEGSVLVTFGTRESNIKGSEINGIIIRQKTEGSPVKAIYKGRIAYITKISGYDNVVIINHGNSDYSVYGNLGNVDLEVGTLVSQGSKLGNINSARTDGSLYFEIRLQGKSVDPLKIVKY